LKSPSPFEKQLSTIYTFEIFKKVPSWSSWCYSLKVRGEGTISIFKVQDFTLKEDFVVVWDEKDEEPSCLCRSSQYKGIICRHVVCACAP
jgi:hypothetical protein